MPTYKGIVSFPKVFTPEVPKGGTEAKFGMMLLFPPTDPQIAQIQAEVQQAKLNAFPAGNWQGADECFQEYDKKFAGKEYYDPRFSGYWVLSTSAKVDDRPHVVDMNYTKVLDPAAVYPGMVAYVNCGITDYRAGKGGIGGWLNGVMITAEDPPMGRLDNKPTVEQMFSGVSPQGIAQAQHAAHQPPAAPAPAPQASVPPTPPAPPAAPAPAPPVALVMTAAANGLTYQQYQASGWTDQQMIDAGVAMQPSFAG